MFEQFTSIKPETVSYAIFDSKSLYTRQLIEEGEIVITIAKISQFCKDWLTWAGGEDDSFDDVFSGGYGLCMNLENWLITQQGVRAVSKLRDGVVCSYEVESNYIFGKVITAYLDMLQSQHEELKYVQDDLSYVFPFGGSAQYSLEKSRSITHLNKQRIEFAKFISELF